MRTKCFDALIEPYPQEDFSAQKYVLLLHSQKFPAGIQLYTEGRPDDPNTAFARIILGKPAVVKWKDTFEISVPGRREPLGRGVVLFPVAEGIKKKKAAKSVEDLRRLLGKEKDMLIALCRDKGILGLRESDIAEFSRLEGKHLESLGKKLEEEGEVKILAFSPFFLISRESFDSLCKKMETFISQFHRDHPEERGISRQRIGKRFAVPAHVLQLALKRLSRAGKIHENEDFVFLSGFEVPLTPREREVLRKLEEKSFQGEFSSVFFKKLQDEFRLSPKSLDKIVAVLIERRNIIKSADGFYIHASWLDEVIEKIRWLRKKDLTVGDFKKITGLTRKYAIPLLELLDEMGVTRRKGPVREILD